MDSTVSEIIKRLNSSSLTKQQYLSTLNEFSRLCRLRKREELFSTFSHKLADTSKPSASDRLSPIGTTSPTLPSNGGPSDRTLTLDDVFRCLKTALFHEAAEVRAAALRAIRYLLKDEQAVEALLRVNLPIFIVRSIDIVLENRTERIQALRLVRKFLSISPHLFPSAFTRSLVAIAQDGQVDHDSLTRACWALLAELSIMSPLSSTRDTQNCAFNAIMDAALSGNQPHGMCESLISTLLYMLNWPRYRCLIHGDLDLQIFVAPFTDSHYTAPVSKDQKQRINQAAKFDVDPYDQRENKFTAAKITLISILRSWQGLIYLCEPQSSECNLVSNSCLRSLINMLYLPYNDVRRRLIDLIFELLYLPLPDSLTDFESGLKFLEKYQLSVDSWKIHDAFVVDEAKAILPPLRTRSRMNLVNDYMALLLVALFHCDVVDALSEVIITPSSQENSIRATILLYQLLSLSYQYLPTDSFSQYLTLSSLISHATSKIDDSRDLANAALINLGRVHPLKKSSNYTAAKCSLFLSQILEYCAPQKPRKSHQQPLPKVANDDTSIGPFPAGATATPLASPSIMSSLGQNASDQTSLNSRLSTITNSPSAITGYSLNYTNHGANSPSSSSSASTLVNSNSSTAPSIGKSTTASNNNVISNHITHLINTGHHPPTRTQSITSRSASILSRSSTISMTATTHLFTLLAFPSSSKANLKAITEQDWQLWDWEYINFILTRPCDAMKKMSSQHYKAFIKRLVHFFKPSSNQYSLIDINNERCRRLCKTGCNLVDFLLQSQEPKAIDLLKELLHDISISMHDPDGSHGGTLSGGTTNYHMNNSNINGSYNSQTINSIGTLSHTLPHHDVYILNPTKLITTMSSTYFLFIGRLSGTKQGFELLEQSGIMRLINNLTQTSMLATNPAEVYVRLIISCFDYTKEFNGSRKLLEKFLFYHPEENIRIYATNFLRVLLRANVADFSYWCIELLIKQLNSSLRVVHHAAADILDEACDLDQHLDGLISLKTVTSKDNETKNTLDILRSTGDAGFLLLSRYASSPEGLRYLMETPRKQISCPLDTVLIQTAKPNSEISGDSDSPNSEQSSGTDAGKCKSLISDPESIISVESEFDVELTRWQRIFNYRYVKLVEDVLNNSLTYHQKGDDGKYGRRIDRINPMTKNSHIPPHLYGQLALHQDGVEIIQARKLLEPTYEILKNPPDDLNYSEISVLKFKAALWIIGNVGSSESGYQILDNSRQLIRIITDVAKNAAVLSLRGTAFYVLGLLGSTVEGAEEMKDYKWIVHRSHKVALPLDLSLILSKPKEEDESSNMNLAPCRAKCSLTTDNVHPILKETYSVAQLEQIRKDILKHVTNLSHSLASRPAENSLLNLKRKFGLIFQYDLGLYSEVCHQLARYNFRLHARRFLQELFLDIA